MVEDKDKTEEVWGLYEDGNLVFKGSKKACEIEWQRRHKEQQRAYHDRNAARQRRWERDGARDDDRDGF